MSGGGVEAWDVRDAIGGWSQSHSWFANETPAGVTCYTLLETLRQYAWKRLDEESETVLGAVETPSIT